LSLDELPFPAVVLMQNAGAFFNAKALVRKLQVPADVIPRPPTAHAVFGSLNHGAHAAAHATSEETTVQQVRHDLPGVSWKIANRPALVVQHTLEGSVCHMGRGQVFAVAANALDIKGGGSRCSSVTVLPLGYRWTALAHLTFGIEPPMLTYPPGQNPGKEDIVGGRDRGSAARFNAQCEELGESIGFHASLTHELCRIFDQDPGSSTFGTGSPERVARVGSEGSLQHAAPVPKPPPARSKKAAKNSKKKKKGNVHPVDAIANDFLEALAMDSDASSSESGDSDGSGGQSDSDVDAGADQALHAAEAAFHAGGGDVDDAPLVSVRQLLLYESVENKVLTRLRCSSKEQPVSTDELMRCSRLQRLVNKANHEGLSTTPAAVVGQIPGVEFSDGADEAPSGWYLGAAASVPKPPPARSKKAAKNSKKKKKKKGKQAGSSAAGSTQKKGKKQPSTAAASSGAQTKKQKKKKNKKNKAAASE